MKKIIIILLFCLLFVPSHALIILGSGKSMLPTFPELCLIKVKTFPYENLEKQMIVIYQYKGALTAHRLVGKTKKGWKVKGDNNKEIDGCLVTKQNYEGLAELVK